MRKKNASFLLVLLLSALSFSCAPKIVIPKIDYKTTTQVHNDMPDCRLEINAALDSLTSTNVLNAFFCYTQVITYLENEYELLEVQLNSIYPQEGQ